MASPKLFNPTLLCSFLVRLTNAFVHSLIRSEFRRLSIFLSISLYRLVHPIHFTFNKLSNNLISVGVFALVVLVWESLIWIHRHDSISIAIHSHKKCVFVLKRDGSTHFNENIKQKICAVAQFLWLSWENLNKLQPFFVDFFHFRLFCVLIV